jgi:SAM-dependent methyltransferase
VTRRDFADCLDDSHVAGIELARGYFEEISHVAEELVVKGWILLPTIAFDSVRILIDGQLADTAAIIGREDVAKAFPQIPHANRSGFRFGLKRPAVSRSRIDILGVERDRARGCLSTLFRPDLDTAVPTPPAELMERVASTRDPMFFKVGGLKSYGEFLRPIERYRPLRSISRMLDWGCGCGRVTAHFVLDAEAGTVHGCDIDSEAVSWCKSHLAPGEFRTVKPLPPTPYDSDSFDLVIGFSVFTHLAREVQHAWLTEMQRVIAPGGLFLASTHGSFAAYFEHLGDSPALLRDGIIDNITDDSLDGIAPQGYYRGVFQTREYTVREWSRYFEIVEYIERGVNFQDLVVMRRRPRSSRGRSSMFHWFRS